MDKREGLDDLYEHHRGLVALPTHTGLRQLIHASQLAAVALHLAQQMLGPGPYLSSATRAHSFGW